MAGSAGVGPSPSGTDRFRSCSSCTASYEDPELRVLISSARFSDIRHRHDDLSWPWPRSTSRRHQGQSCWKTRLRYPARAGRIQPMQVRPLPAPRVRHRRMYDSSATAQIVFVARSSYAPSADRHPTHLPDLEDNFNVPRRPPAPAKCRLPWPGPYRPHSFMDHGGPCFFRPLNSPVQLPGRSQTGPSSPGAGTGPAVSFDILSARTRRLLHTAPTGDPGPQHIQVDLRPARTRTHRPRQPDQRHTGLRFPDRLGGKLRGARLSRLQVQRLDVACWRRSMIDSFHDNNLSRSPGRAFGLTTAHRCRR